MDDDWGVPLFQETTIYSPAATSKHPHFLFVSVELYLELSIFRWASKRVETDFIIWGNHINHSVTLIALMRVEMMNDAWYPGASL